MPVDARTGIPSAVLLLRIVYAHSDDVLPLLKPRGDIVNERRISIMMNAERMAVHIDFSIHVYAFEIKAVTLLQQIGRQAESLSVPTFSRRTIAAVIT